MKEKLLSLGFTKNESQVYVTLCRYESLTGHELAKKAGIDRSVTYNLLNNLLKKGLVGSVVKKKKKEFFVTEPDNLLREIEMKESIARNLIKEVEAIRKKKESKTVIETYEGLVGARKFYSLIEKYPGDIFYTFGGNGKMIEKTRLYLPHYKKFFENKLSSVKFLMPKGYLYQDEFHSIANTKTKKTDMQLHDASCSIIGDYVVFHIYQDEPMQILIKNESIVSMMTDFFEYVWRQTNK